MRRRTKIKANNNRRNRNRVWNFLVSKLSIKPIEPELTIDDYDVPTFYAEDEDDRFERHMNAIRGKNT